MEEIKFNQITTDEFNDLPSAVYKKGKRGIIVDKKATKIKATNYYNNKNK